MPEALSKISPATFAEFKREAQEANVVAVATRISAGSFSVFETFSNLAANANFAFLFESVEGREGSAAYSFMGCDPHCVVRGRGNKTFIERDGITETRDECVMDYVRRHFREHKIAQRTKLGPLAGGAVGFLGYGAASWFDAALVTANNADCDADDALFMFYDRVVVFDHLRQQLEIVSLVFTEQAEGSEPRLRQLYESACEAIKEIESRMQSANRPTNERAANVATSNGLNIRSNFTREDFQNAVCQVKQHIAAGDCYQVVLSQKFGAATPAQPLEIYRALRQTNPAPYLYFLKLNGQTITGASPEMLVRCRGRQLDYRPIAGTRPRGRTENEDRALAEEMRNDEKEVAEHMMLVDLGRNDLGRVAAFGSVQLSELMSVERYSKVQHLVSSLRAELRDDCDRFEALAACFPAGTVTGAPKVRATEIIQQLERDQRGVYAGAILYADYAGNLDSCIAIRTIVINGTEASVQAGAGIVADSIPENEYEETLRKAEALFVAINLAESQR